MWTFTAAAAHAAAESDGGPGSRAPRSRRSGRPSEMLIGPGAIAMRCPGSWARTDDRQHTGWRGYTSTTGRHARVFSPPYRAVDDVFVPYRRSDEPEPRSTIWHIQPGLTRCVAARVLLVLLLMPGEGGGPYIIEEPPPLLLNTLGQSYGSTNGSSTTAAGRGCASLGLRTRAPPCFPRLPLPSHAERMGLGLTVACTPRI